MRRLSAQFGNPAAVSYWNHNIHYQRLILHAVPQDCGDQWPTSAAAPFVIRSNSPNDVGNTVCGCPAAAQTTS